MPPTACCQQAPLLAPCPARLPAPNSSAQVWEHAYYLQYKNVRADYAKAIMQVVNWRDVAKRYDEVSDK